MLSDDDDQPLVSSNKATTPTTQNSVPTQTTNNDRSTQERKPPAGKRPRKQSLSSDNEFLLPTSPPSNKRPRTKRAQRQAPREEEDSDEEPLSTKQRAPRTKKTAPVRQRTTRVATKKQETFVKKEVEEDDATKARLHFRDGQRFLSPPMGDGTRAFYESLLKENPNSVMANRYCIEHGVLIGTQHKEQWLRYQQLKDLGAFKGAFGGIRTQFKNGILKNDLETWKQMREVKTGAKKKGREPKDET